MAPTWQTVSEDTLRIRYASGGWGRRLLGILLVLMGAEIFSWLFERGVLSGGPTPYGLYHSCPNDVRLMLFLLTSALFVLPGVILLFSGKRMEIDSPNGEIREMQDYVLWRAATHHYDFSEVACVRGKGDSTGRHAGKYRLEVVINRGAGATRRVFAAHADSKDVTRVLGNIMAEKLGVPFEDLT